MEGYTNHLKKYSTSGVRPGLEADIEVDAITHEKNAEFNKELAVLAGVEPEEKKIVGSRNSAQRVHEELNHLPLRKMKLLKLRGLLPNVSWEDIQEGFTCDTCLACNRRSARRGTSKAA